MEQLTRHPLSALWGDMPEDQYREFVEGIRERHIRQMIMTLDGKILDGWHRYKACLELGIDPFFAEYTGDDPAGYVISQNAHRRHLTAGQRAICIAKCYEWAGMGSNQHSGEGVHIVHTLQESESDKGTDGQSGELRDISGVATMGASTGTAGVVCDGDTRGTSSEDGAMGQADLLRADTEGVATERETITAGQLAERADVSKRTADSAKAIIRAGLDDAVIANEVPFSAAAAQAKGEPNLPKGPTPKERLEAQVDALAMEVQEKAEENERLERALREARAQMSEYPHEREKAATEREAIISTLRSQLNEYMVRANEDSQSLRYWKREAKQPCRKCGTEWEFTND